MKYIILFFVYVLAFFAPGHIFAYELRFAPDISIGEGYISEENLYLASLKTFFAATYENDVVSVSWNQLIRGTVFGDVTLIGNETSLEGEMFDDVRIIGNKVRVTGVTNKDLVIVANNVTIEKDAIINGDLLVLANKFSTEGQFLGESQVTANVLTVAGTVNGPATFTAQKLLFGSSARVTSDISYFSPQRATIGEGAHIQSPLNFNQIESIKQNDVVKKIFFGFVSFWSIIKLIATLFVIFMLAQVFKVFTQRVTDIVHEKKALLFLTGFASILIIPLTMVLLFATLILIPVSVMLGLVLGIIIILLPALSSIVIASVFQDVVLNRKKTPVDFNTSALALIALTFISFVPYLGDVILYLTYLATFGAIMHYLYEQIRRKNIKI